ncbi:type II toxin-antitoxin system HicA family toxin [Caminicella sporogenes]|uniref:type II toxin-antitoxin system HicA family toxin n=1 Tax=Caminicella sporogenes TaxID=166485 RepID=UPI002541F8D9|nr:type II toxin-antitoxin system HicA family toxin [Caminicella sporogenes]WIF94094.1 type II toxin-antitoxin system HicA family toxin [Caminicella sporogenes]
MKSYSSREIIKILEKDGWYLKRTKGDHYQFKHQTKKGSVTVPHPKKDLPVKTVKSIFKQAGIEELKE